MWGDMAKSCQKHLKPNDFIYVSGHLQSYAKVDENGNLRLRYKVCRISYCFVNMSSILLECIYIYIYISFGGIHLASSFVWLKYGIPWHS